MADVTNPKFLQIAVHFTITSFTRVTFCCSATNSNTLKIKFKKSPQTHNYQENVYRLLLKNPVLQDGVLLQYSKPSTSYILDFFIFFK